MWYIINIVDNELYMMEISANDVFVINTDDNIVIKEEIGEGITKAQIKNTFGWHLLISKFNALGENEIMEEILSSDRNYYKAISALE